MKTMSENSDEVMELRNIVKELLELKNASDMEVIELKSKLTFNTLCLYIIIITNIIVIYRSIQ